MNQEDIEILEELRSYFGDKALLKNDDESAHIHNALLDAIKIVKAAVTPERPKGKWIEIFVETPNDPYSYGFKAHKCSKCEYRPLQISNYCPNCGAEMSGGEEE